MRALNSRRIRPIVTALALLVVISTPAAAQGPSAITGVVRDAAGRPVAGATVTIDFHGHTNRHFRARTNKNGDFVFAGLRSGDYTVTVVQDRLSAIEHVRLARGGATAPIHLVIRIAGRLQ